MVGDTAEELEKFRQQWQEEVTARIKGASSSTSTRKSTKSQTTQKDGGNTGPGRASKLSFHTPYREVEDDDGIGGSASHDLEDKDEARKLGGDGQGIHPDNRHEPSSALEHYEKAVERESQGRLGDSLNHYRKAFRLDAGVDRIYKNKHFPPSSSKSKPSNPNPSNAAVTVPNPAHHSLDGPPASTISELIASFSTTSIPQAEPPTDASPAPPCPISTLPFEILIYALFQIAITDAASFARLSLVCKRLAYLVATEDRLWRRVCLGPEAGFTGMHYAWACTISGNPLHMSVGDLDEDLSKKLSSLHLKSPVPAFDPFPLTPKYPNYKHMFHHRPRIRFNGCYISTVNYMRPGGNSNTTSHATWSTPVHIVTYFRYLRFFRDGTCASLLTTTEPADVVHYLTRENMHTHHASGLPSSVMNNCLRGRWKLSGNPYKNKPLPVLTSEETPSTNDEEEQEEEGTLHIETEGADFIHPHPKYIYKMMLSLKSAGRAPGATRNNKLVWLGYWSYNKLTDDWSEFGLKNDKAFFWSRVKSYGNGE
ncbi:hypothetical protein ACLMJK_007905 [Lecanora helva]